MLMCSIAVGSRILTKGRQTNYLCAILRLSMLIDMGLLFKRLALYENLCGCHYHSNLLTNLRYYPSPLLHRENDSV